mgnify:FL=1
MMEIAHSQEVLICNKNLKNYSTDSHRQVNPFVAENSATPIANEILKQNKREYGNGLNKFEPGDLNEANILNIKKLYIKDRDSILGQYELLRKKEAKEECVILKLNERFKRYLELPSSDRHRT